MLETLDLSLDIPKKTYHAEFKRLGYQLQGLQQLTFEAKVPVLVNFEGWDAAGKGDAISCLVQNMDPRGYKVHLTREPTEEEAMFPFLRRFWLRLPGKGEIAIFNRSYYYALYRARLQERIAQMEWERLLHEVKNFERQLIDEGTTILSFWLHVSKAEQKRRMTAWAKDKVQDWRVSERDWENHRRYKDILGHIEEMFALTHTHNSPWVLVEAENERHRRIKVMAETALAFRRALVRHGIDEDEIDDRLRHFEEDEEGVAPEDAPDLHREDTLPLPLEIPADSPLARIDLSLAVKKKDYNARLDTAQDRMRELGFLCYRHRQPVVMVFEGWDAGGKGGAIKRLIARIDPRGYAVIPISAPSGAEIVHHYLWRFWHHIPKDGHLALFDRSWYGRVLVERVEGFCSEAAWRRAYQEINEFEYSIARHGTVVLKFWLHISPEEQLSRFRRRERIPHKNHKITEEDWRNRAKWPEYLEAVSDMLRQTSTPYAPWVIVEADDKLHARLKVIETTVAALETALKPK